MAFQATHVRFAHALLDKADVCKEVEYYSGAVYPDSRYVTGIDRDLTHRHEVPNMPFLHSMTDFEKGWATHLFYDKYASRELRKLFDIQGRTDFGNDDWLKITAAKLIEDMESCERLGSTLNSIQSICPVGRPCNEDEDRLHTWYNALKEVYTGGRTSFSCYEKSFIHTKDFPVTRLREVVASFERDDRLVTEIHQIFDQIINMYD